MDGLVRVVLKGRIGQIREDPRLVDHGTRQLADGTGVEHTTRKIRVGDTVDESRRTHFKFVGNTEVGHDVFGGEA